MWILELVGVVATLLLITSLLTSRLATYPSSTLSHHHHLMIHVAGASIWSHHHHPMSSFALLPTSHQVDSTWRRHHHLRHPWRSKTLAKQPPGLELTQLSIALQVTFQCQPNDQTPLILRVWSWVRIPASLQAVNESVMWQCSWGDLWRLRKNLCCVQMRRLMKKTTHVLWNLQLMMWW